MCEVVYSLEVARTVGVRIYNARLCSLLQSLSNDWWTSWQFQEFEDCCMLFCFAACFSVSDEKSRRHQKNIHI